MMMMKGRDYYVVCSACWGQQLIKSNQCSDYDVFLSPLSDFKKAMEEAGLGDKVVYLDRKDAYQFRVKE